MRFSIIPREPKFFDMFERSAANVAATLREFAAFLEDFTNVQDKVAHIIELEHEGDHIAHNILEELHCTFITPLDREDIALLAQRLDDMVDFVVGRTLDQLGLKNDLYRRWAGEATTGSRGSRRTRR